jgi:hypothetical protein
MTPFPAWLAAHRAQAWAWWLVPAIALGVLIGWEIDWGRQLIPVPPPPSPVAPKPAEAAVLPEYRVDGGLAAHSETVNRTLFNATRRPAPVLALDEAGSRRIQRGQFQLVGTAVTGERNIAFLKEVSGGKARTVHQGDEINGMKVVLVAPDRVKFAAGNDSEELLLKVGPGPKKTTAAPPAVPGVPPVAGAQPTVAAPPPLPPTQAVTAAAQSRRAARAAAAAAAAASHEVTPGAGGAPPPGQLPSAVPPQPQPQPNVTPPQPQSNAMPPASDASWAAVYRRMQSGQ